MKAKIIKDAHEIFLDRNRKIFKGVLPRSYLEYADIVKEFEGVVMDVAKEYRDRIVLQYPEVIIRDHKNVTGIDIERDLVEIV